MGYGLVVGLQNTGDSGQSSITSKTLENLLSKMGLPGLGDSNNKNVASVLVTSELPAFAKLGQKIDITVSSMGDASSLKGGVLIQTPLMAANGKVYAVAQGAIVSGVKDGMSKLVKNTVSIPGGAIVENIVSINFLESNYLTIALNNADFSQAAIVAEALNANGIGGAKAIDASTVQVPMLGDDKENIVELIAHIENVKVNPAVFAKVVINEKTGAIVIGQFVQLLPAVVSYSNLNVIIGEQEYSSILNDSDSARVIKLEPEATLSSLAKALQSIGATTSDLISILQVLKKAGALQAELITL